MIESRPLDEETFKKFLLPVNKEPCQEKENETKVTPESTQWVLDNIDSLPACLYRIRCNNGKPLFFCAGVGFIKTFVTREDFEPWKVIIEPLIEEENESTT
jgi:hypothetical protein